MVVLTSPVHITVPPDWNVARGHRVASAIEYEIELALGEGNATAHVEPCPAEACGVCNVGPDSAAAGVTSADGGVGRS